MFKKSIDYIIFEIKTTLDNLKNAFNFKEDKLVKSELENLLLEVHDLINEYLDRIER